MSLTVADYWQQQLDRIGQTAFLDRSSTQIRLTDSDDRHGIVEARFWFNERTFLDA